MVQADITKFSENLFQRHHTDWYLVSPLSYEKPALFTPYVHLITEKEGSSSLSQADPA